MRLGTATRAQIEDLLDQVHTCMPGRVVSYDGTTGLATIDPAGLDDDGNPWPRLFNVPVAHIQYGSLCIVGKLSPGDRVELRFVERSMDEFMGSGQAVEALDPRRHHLSDAIASPGFTIRSGPPGLASTVDAIRIGSSNGYIDILAAGDFRIARGADELISVLHTALDALSTATAGGSPLDPVTVPILEAAVIALANLGADV